MKQTEGECSQDDTEFQSYHCRKRSARTAAGGKCKRRRTQKVASNDQEEVVNENQGTDHQQEDQESNRHQEEVTQDQEKVTEEVIENQEELNEHQEENQEDVIEHQEELNEHQEENQKDVIEYQEEMNEHQEENQEDVNEGQEEMNEHQEESQEYMNEDQDEMNERQEDMSEELNEHQEEMNEHHEEENEVNYYYQYQGEVSYQQNHAVDVLLRQLAMAQATNQVLRNMLVLKTNIVKGIRGNDQKTCFYTGLPMYCFQYSIRAVEGTLSLLLATSERLKENEFLAVLMKLHLDTPMQDLAYRLGCSLTSFSNIFHEWLKVMYYNLKQLIIWPDADTLRANLPEAFKNHYRNAICIIDCFEVFIQRPLSFEPRASSFSNYKRHNTINVLVAVAPTGSITFISKARGGRVSDKVITQECGFLEKILPGDVVLADRGFNVQDELAIRQAKLELPSFTRGKKQLSQQEVEMSRQLARVRIHVEHVIGQLRKKYKILQHTLPITLIKRPRDPIPTIDRILVVTAALTNLSPSVV